MTLSAEVSEVTRGRHAVLKRLAVALGTVLALAALLVGGWMLWISLRPAPEGFAPTTGEAGAVAGAPAAALQYTIDARSRKEWVYFNFSRGQAVSTERESVDWDLAFRRTDILTNGGETNPDGLGGAIDLDEAGLEGGPAPADGYLTDASDEERGLENPALHGWYNYNWTTHTVTSKEHTYALRTAAGEVVLLTFVSYYCDDDSAGCVTFRYTYS